MTLELNRKFNRVFLVGAFPPPVHGMAVVNAFVKESLEQLGASPQIIDLAALSLSRSSVTKIRRLFRVSRRLSKFVFAKCASGDALYMSVSGGFGQFYELLFVTIARLRGIRVFLHHHSFSYLDRRSRLFAWLVNAAGDTAVHIVLSPKMETLLRTGYSVNRAIFISNAVMLWRREAVTSSHSRMHTLGFISNLSSEKGVFEFLDLLEACGRAGFPLQGKLAGPFQDPETELLVRSRLKSLANVQYVGPKFGIEKERFFSGIDVLVFPTLYVNEAEPLTVHEAMSHSVPVIAYGRGAIPEIVKPGTGRVISVSGSFVPCALEQVEAWLKDPDDYAAASRAAALAFVAAAEESRARWNLIVSLLAKNRPV